MVRAGFTKKATDKQMPEGNRKVNQVDVRRKAFQAEGTVP